ncbi:MAG: tRNA pseudouridine(38-40) synthase TruA [Alphaproteobacteria bacterium]|nr:tRNA pseudouridine(38-40) synthase TruA [Alphaproteobacteria bacterium]
MRRFKVIIEYDGTGFRGWQKQLGQLSVQEVLENAIFQFSKESVSVTGSGRTDAGVHALGQVAHFDLASTIEASEIPGAINFYSRPHKISILSCSEVSENFHARFSAVQRTYIYKLINRYAPLALDSYRAWWVKKDLDEDIMKKASKYLIGMHDFSSLRASSCQALSPIKTIDDINIARIGDAIEIEVSARSFLHHMVRNIVGTLVEVGVGKTTLSEIPHILDAKDRSAAGVKAPPWGLYFAKVKY